MNVRGLESNSVCWLAGCDRAPSASPMHEPVDRRCVQSDSTWRDRGTDDVAREGTVIGRRSGRTWLVLGLRVAAAAGFVASFVLQHGWRWVPLLIAGAALLVLIAMRDKGPAKSDASWNGSADLLAQGRKYPGQLSFSAHSVAWVPTNYSMRHGARKLDFPNDSRLGFESGTALLDVVVTVRPVTGNETRFLAHRRPWADPSYPSTRAFHGRALGCDSDRSVCSRRNELHVYPRRIS